MGVMQTALSALRAYELMLSVTANNLANLNTPGYKSQSLHFLDIFYQTLQGATAPKGEEQGGQNPIQVGMGVVVGAVITRGSQGMVTPTGVPTDLSLIGNGFFAVAKEGTVLFTRDGAFRVDAQGNLVHVGTGARLLGWMAIESGTIRTTGEMQPIRIPQGAMEARATSKVRIGGNLDARDKVGTTREVSFTVIDSLGSEHVVRMEFTKRANNQWDWRAELEGLEVGTGTVTFGAEGKWVEGTGKLFLPLTNGAASPQEISLDFSGMTQLSALSTVSAVFQDGFPAGVLESISVDARGVIIGGFSNGITRPLAQVAVAVFANPEGLERVGENMFKASSNSGLPRWMPAGEGGAGRIQAGGLEQSNVDIAKELTEVLVAQRSFQAAARVILAADEMTQEALNLRR